MINERLLKTGEYSAAGLYEEENRSLFYRKALGLRCFFETCELPTYNGELLYPSGRAKMPFYYDNIVVDFEKIDSDISAKIKKDFLSFESSVPIEHCVAGNMFTHSFPNYERILKEGFSSYLERIEKVDDKDFSQGLVHLVKGIETYIKRCVEYLKSVNANEKLISALSKVPMKPCENIYEAVVAWNFVLYLDCCDNLGCVASGLLPYYNGENIVPLLENLFQNLNDNDGYSMALHTGDNPLTLQCLEAAYGKRRPMIELFVDENTPLEVWDKAFEVIKTTGGQPAFYNPQLLSGLKNKFENISDLDLKRFCGGGCTESMIAGLSNVGSLDAGINLLLIFENVLKAELLNTNSFEEFYSKYIEEVEKVVEIVTREIGNSQKMRAVYNPLPMRTLLVDDCIDKGLDFNNGGARYKWSIVNFAGLINVIDSMLVVRDLVFDDKTLSKGDLLCKLENNDKAFLEKLKNHKNSYGKDIENVNEFSNKLSTDVYSMLDNKKTDMCDGFIPASIQFMYQVEGGKNIGATPDGREKGAPLCDSLGAIFEKDINGPTALLKSVTSLDLKSALGVPVLNFNINPDFKNEVLRALILGYMKMGGIQMQITCISKETLLEAYENPNLHRNIVVRVGGYSEYFHLLSDELKQMIIERTIQKEI